MKVVMTLKSGLILELPLQQKSDVEFVLQQMKSFKKFFEWQNRIWVNKKEVASFEIVEQAPKIEETI